mgnify:CR=1 FL=1
MYSLPSLSFVREDYNIGISVGKKIGNAPVRNKQKRIVRDIVRKLAKEKLKRIEETQKKVLAPKQKREKPDQQ